MQIANFILDAAAMQNSEMTATMIAQNDEKSESWENWNFYIALICGSPITRPSVARNPDDSDQANGN